MFTILQARDADGFNIFEVVDHATNLKDAADKCADLCNKAGVVRTIAIDYLGSTVCVES